MVPRRPQSEAEQTQADVAAYVAVGADESVQRIITAINRLSKRLAQWYDRQLADLDVSAGEWNVLQSLAREPGGEPLTPSRLAEASGIAPSSMTHRLDRMVDRGLVTRDPDPENRTRVLVRLSEEGRKLFAVAILDSNMVEADLMTSLSDRQKEQLISLLDRLIHGLDHADL
jgi:DNA-binding MarR family transcriptional regulator